MAELEPLAADVLPAGVRARFVEGVNGLRMHVLQAGHEQAGRACVLLLHGFPEIAYSCRKVMPALAAAGYRVLAPDQPGYGRPKGRAAASEGGPATFRFFKVVRGGLGPA